MVSAADPSTSDATILPSTLTLSPGILSSFKPSRVFKSHNESGKSYTSLAFDDRGELLITAAEDETMQLFSCKTGKHQKQLYSKKYGVHLARFTHKSSAIIHASTKEDDGIRYLSLHDNNYLRYFKGHKKKVVSLEMSPQDDTFLSGATDDTVRLWDLRTQNAQGLLNIAGSPSVAYDPAGTVFAVALNLRSTILLYDFANFDKQPFLNVQLDDNVLGQRSYPPRVPIYTSLKFSNDGKLLLVGTSGDTHYVLDAFTGRIVARLETPTFCSGLERSIAAPYDRPQNPVAGISSEELSWTPEGRFVISGSIDGKVHVWDVSGNQEVQTFARDNPPPHVPAPTLHPIKTMEGHLSGPSRIVKFNPRTAMMASAGNDLQAFWLPDPKDPAFPKTESS
ncbi:WD repeat protein 82 [Pseudohyphozyma bogoriensis]|nr:WD repeat protein 82 [Pseudohyphozyma bogoriensis]